jgi:hypothetical protein
MESVMFFLQNNFFLIEYIFNLAQFLDNLIGTKKLAQSILITSPKPYFLFWDKIYSKLSTYEEEFWLIRALEGVLLDKDGALLKNNDAQ